MCHVALCAFALFTSVGQGVDAGISVHSLPVHNLQAAKKAALEKNA
jgi:hypothetical protein